MPAKMVDKLYKTLTAALSGNLRDLKGDPITDHLVATVMGCSSFLQTLTNRPLTSFVVGKKYFMFEHNGKTSRPVNIALFNTKPTAAALKKVISCDVEGMTSDAITKIVYTAIQSYCCCTDLLKSGDQKTPGTFFEILIGHMVSKSLGVNPERQIRVPTLDLDITIPTDFVFDLGPGKNRVHLPIKISTRERVVQVWAHQRVLDGMHGVARFKGILVAMAEMNKQKDISVAEVCLPNQWMAYQMYIAQMFRVYYLDIPTPYLKLKETYPFIQVKPFGDFFSEIDKIEKSGVGGA